MNLPLAPEDHFVKVAGFRSYSEHETLNGPTILFDSSLFLPRADHPPGHGPEEYVSGDWLEYFPGTLLQQLVGCREAVIARRRTVGKFAMQAVVQVAAITSGAVRGGKSTTVQTTGEPSDPSHTGIYGLEPEDDIIAQDIANSAAGYLAFSADP